MKKMILIIFSGLSLASCTHTESVPVPSVGAVKQNITQAGGSIDEASKASNRSSQHIKELRSNASTIDFKTIKALELL